MNHCESPNAFSHIADSLESTACDLAIAKIKEESKKQLAHWTEQCKTHHNAEDKVKLLTSTLNHFVELANRYQVRNSPEKLLLILDQVRKYDPR